MKRLLRRIAGFLRWVSAREQVPAPLQRGDAGHRTPGPVSRLLTREVLADNEPAASRRPSLVTWVAAPQQLVEPPRAQRQEAERSPGFLRWILGAEMLAAGHRPARDRSSRPGFLRWLLSTDHLPPATSDHGT